MGAGKPETHYKPLNFEDKNEKRGRRDRREDTWSKLQQLRNDKGKGEEERRWAGQGREGWTSVGQEKAGKNRAE